MAHQHHIVLKDVSKRYWLRDQRPLLAHELVQRYLLRRQTRREFWALKEVNMTVDPGETVAIVGRNGAGKSTMLGAIAGTVFPTQGTVEVHGRIGALLELGAGFHPDLTGRENVFLNASLLGCKQHEVEAQYEQIIEFAEIKDFIDIPLRNYSSGMQVRLGFAVAIHINPDIIIMDEVFAVGDREFQEKCMERIGHFKEENKTLLFVTHSLTRLQHICDRAIWLDCGRVEADGPLQDVLEQYEQACEDHAHPHAF